MKLFKRLVWDQFAEVLRRDSLSVLSSWVAFSFALMWLWHEEWLPPFEVRDLSRLVATAASGVSLFLAIRLWAHTRKERLLASALGVLSLVVLTMWVGKATPDLVMYRFFHWFLLTHLLVALAPLRDLWGSPRSAQDQGLWRFNWYLLTRFIFGFGFCAILTAGLLGALGILKPLFNIRIEDEWFGSVGYFCLFVVSVFQVLSSIANTRVGPQSETVTRDLRRLIQYLFTPLSLVYFLIAYSYILKILIMQEWPKGVVGWLVSILTICVFLIFVLQRPLADLETFPKWMRSFWRWSFALLIPPVVVLIFAITRRVSDYGLTESRVVLQILSWWALAVCVYYFRPEKRKLAWLPISLTVVVALTFAGPLNPHFISFMSQKHELFQLIEEGGGRLENGKYVWLERPSFSAQKRLSSIVEYLCDTQGDRKMLGVLGVTWEASRLGKNSDCWEGSHGMQMALEGLDINYVERWETEKDAATNAERNEKRRNGPHEVSDLKSYSYPVGESEAALFSFFANQQKEETTAKGKQIYLKYVCCAPEIFWLQNAGDPVKIDLLPLIQKSQESVFAENSGGQRLTLWLTRATHEQEKNSTVLRSNLDLFAVLSPKGAPVERQKIEE